MWDVNGSVKGSVNGESVNGQFSGKLSFELGTVDVTLSSAPHSMLSSIGLLMPVLSAPLGWLAGLEINTAVNGLSVTNGSFYVNSVVVFPDGERLEVIQTVTRDDKEHVELKVWLLGRVTRYKGTPRITASDYIAIQSGEGQISFVGKQLYRVRSVYGEQAYSVYTNLTYAKATLFLSHKTQELLFVRSTSGVSHGAVHYKATYQNRPGKSY